MTDWGALTARTLAGIEACEPIYRPTTFWGPGVRRLLDDLDTEGLGSFKSWSMAATWFYSTYGNGFTKEAIERTFVTASQINPAAQKPWFVTALTGAYQARRDLDAARLAWDQARWPFDLEGLGESKVGKPPQFFRLHEADRRIGWTRPYLNYLLCLAALSRHVESAPRAFLEIGGGYGVLGEIVMSRDPDARYVNFDLPPLMTVSSYYLDALFGDRVTVYDDAIADTGAIEIAGSASLPNWRIDDVAGPFDVFTNSFSFQEMEPDVVAHYIAQVAAKDVPYVVSLNSRAGKPKAVDGNDIGVDDPVTSQRIVDLFQGHGYEVLGRYGDPLIQSAGELVIMGRSGRTSSRSSPLPARSATGSTGSTDYRRKPPARPATREQPPHPSRLVRLARDWVPPKLLRATRGLRGRSRNDRA